MMGRYQISYSDKKAGYNKTPEVHPIWRGIGFALIILIPVLSYFAGLLVIAANALHNYVSIPPELIAPKGDPYLYLKIILTVVISFLIYILFMMITFVINRLFGPPRYGPLDMPPLPIKVHKRWK
jgi:hypothetical protein